ncbi:hypothetical protein RFI_18073 [Reticulomyxa filosa]|uniref:Uncharacterized protein n=1 Tax=Reticulomyxa filosa TaxID=46433 RepID=X6MZA1_RETFI|nr:hypothetical protein RFI_18073 [Reticulomyxa filosa]|eukprot:ETO19156.1 hypothetical protein RFI_18073 [Reticulomyxa filosa]
MSNIRPHMDTKIRLPFSPLNVANSSVDKIPTGYLRYGERNVVGFFVSLEPCSNQSVLSLNAPSLKNQRKKYSNCNWQKLRKEIKNPKCCGTNKKIPSVMLILQYKTKFVISANELFFILFDILKKTKKIIFNIVSSMLTFAKKIVLNELNIVILLREVCKCLNTVLSEFSQNKKLNKLEKELAPKKTEQCKESFKKEVSEKISRFHLNFSVAKTATKTKEKEVFNYLN